MAIDPTKKALTRVTCAQHVVPHLRAELEALGHEIQGEDHVGVHIGASLVDCLGLTLRLRTAHHVMWLLKRFRCPSPAALYTHTASYPWEELIATDAYLSVVSNVENPKINNTMYPNLVVKDAVVDRITRKTGARPDSGSDRSGVVLHLYWKGDRAWLYLNVNGPRLSDRGYRKIPHLAPMRETLAAAVLLAIGYDGTQPLVNPMCGSGTLAIEAALIAAGRAPGLLRNHASALFTRLELDEDWAEARREARKSRSVPSPAPIVASDHDPRALDAARRNAQTAGVDHLIEFAQCDFADTPLPPVPGHLVLNPEYGQRLGEAETLALTYEGIGDFFKKRCSGWTGHVFTGSRELANQIGLRPSRRLPFMNAQIECRLLSYALYEGSRKAAAGVPAQADPDADDAGGAQA